MFSIFYCILKPTILISSCISFLLRLIKENMFVFLGTLPNLQVPGYKFWFYTYWPCFLEQVNQPLISLLICKMGETVTPNSQD